MALGVAAPAPILRPAAQSHPFTEAFAIPAIWGAFLTLVVAGPWLLPGYLFGTDWPGPRTIPFPTDLSSSAALQFALATSSRLLGGETTGKVLIVGSLFSGAVLAYRAVPKTGFIPGAVGATIYIANPFVYGRLHYGQVYLLAGYAALPWVALRLRRLLLEPNSVTGLVAAVSVVLLGVLSLHFFFMTAALGTAVLGAYVIGRRDGRLAYAKRLVSASGLAVAATLLASAYWIIPLVRGSGPEGTRLAGITSGDVYAFASIPDNDVGLVPNLLGLYGFWGEATGRFTSMKEFVPGWPTVLGLILVLCGVGVVATFKKRDVDLSPWIAGLLVTAGLALLLEMGVAHPWTAGAVQLLDTHLSLYRGMRDAVKWAAFLALSYSQLGGLGAVTILDWVKSRARGYAQQEWATGVAAGVLLALPLYYGNGLLFGAHGEIRPSQYPAGWYAADRLLASDSHPGRTLILPWHEYMSYEFVQNQNRIVASPAPEFFSVPVLASTNPEVVGMSPPTDPDQTAVSNLVAAGDKGQWPAILAAHGVRYVLLARELDWQAYGFLESQPGLSKVADFGSILVFRNSFSP